MSETNPETGTKTYVYDADHHVIQRTDAKGQRTNYTYDSHGRLETVRKYSWTGVPPTLTEMVNQRVDYYYDSNPLQGGFTEYAAGRLAAVLFHNERGRVGRVFRVHVQL